MYFLSIFQDIHNEFRLHVQKLKNVSLKKIICNLDFNLIKVQLGFDMSSWNYKFTILSHLFLLPSLAEDEESTFDKQFLLELMVR